MAITLWRALPSPLPHEWGTEPCLDLVNSSFNDHLGSGSVHDRLPLPVWRRAFLKQWNYRVDDPDDRAALSHLRRLRSTLRRALERYSEGMALEPSVRRALESEINRAPFVMRISHEHGGERLVLERKGGRWNVAIADVATSAARLMAEGRRVKVCANPSCSWMFEDESRSASRRWCDVSICGSLINVRRHRESR